MGRKHKPSIPSYLYDSYPGENFAMIPPALFEAKAFQGLSYAARTFYLLIVVHKSSYAHQTCLYETMKAYNDILQLGMNEEDLKQAVWGNKRQHTFSNLFVIPAKHLEAYGYTPQYANKLKQELIEKGFIKVKYGGKGKHVGWGKNVTVYEFSSQWKTKYS